MAYKGIPGIESGEFDQEIFESLDHSGKGERTTMGFSERAIYKFHFESKAIQKSVPEYIRAMMYYLVMGEADPRKAYSGGMPPRREGLVRLAAEDVGQLEEFELAIAEFDSQITRAKAAKAMEVKRLGQLYQQTKIDLRRDDEQREAMRNWRRQVNRIEQEISQLQRSVGAGPSEIGYRPGAQKQLDDALMELEILRLEKPGTVVTVAP